MSRFSRDINVIDRYLRHHRRQYMEPLGLKGIHARLIMHISRRPGSSQEWLARQMGFDKSTIARQLELMEDKGFVTRKPSQRDKRVLCVYPTEQMLLFQPGLQEAMSSWEQTLLQDLTPQELAQLEAMLEKIRLRAEPEGLE